MKQGNTGSISQISLCRIQQMITRTSDGSIIPSFLPLDIAFIKQSYRTPLCEGCSFFDQRLQHSLVFIDLLAYQLGTLIRKILELGLLLLPE